MANTSVRNTELGMKRTEIGRQLAIANTKGDRELTYKLRKEYYYLGDAIKLGITTCDKLNRMVKANEFPDFESTLKKQNKIVKSAMQEIQSEPVNKKAPEDAFKEMRGYLSMVTSGIQPGLIICGAPGIGKTYRVMKYLKMHGYENNSNMHIIKGRCTPRNLYIDMYNYQNKGEILVIDDADALIGPKATEDTINILKSALDSNDDGDGRTVAYRVTGRLIDDDGQEIPKEFKYRGSVIVLTNYNIGQLDSAFKGRVFTQDLSFTSQQLLDLIKKLMPAIEPENLSPVSKMKAYDFLSELADDGQKIEISIRSFVTCSRLFEMQAKEPDFTDEEVRSMIKDQVTNQALRGGKKY